MTTILDEPYMMLAKPRKGVKLSGNDRYEGYCKVRITQIISKTARGITSRVKTARKKNKH